MAAELPLAKRQCPAVWDETGDPLNEEAEGERAAEEAAMAEAAAAAEVAVDSIGGEGV